MDRVTAIVPAAGLGLRFGPMGKKPFALLLGKPLIRWALEALEISPEVTDIIAVLRDEDRGEAEEVLAAFSKVRAVAPGGRQRQDSVLSGLRQAEGAARIVLIHDGARPLVSEALIRDTLAGLAGFDGAVAAVPPKDTIKEAGKEAGNEAGRARLVKKTLRRDELWAVQTPQVFAFDTLVEAYEKAAREGFYSTDDSALVERTGGRVNIVMGSYENIKITTPEDILVAEALLRARQAA